MRTVDEELLNGITARIVESIHPEKIILFGSHAWGKPDETSDVDLLVIVSHSDEPSYRRATRIYSCLHGIGVPLDVIVQTHDEVELYSKVITSLTRTALERGKILYG